MQVLFLGKNQIVFSLQKKGGRKSYRQVNLTVYRNDIKLLNKQLYATFLHPNPQMSQTCHEQG